MANYMQVRPNLAFLLNLQPRVLLMTVWLLIRLQTSMIPRLGAVLINVHFILA